MKKDSFHVDMSGRIYEERTIGIAIVGTETKINYGCALKGNLVKLVKKKLFKKNIYEDSAKLYGICISLLVKEVVNNINLLIICNDEDFDVVKQVLSKLIKPHFEIISISEFRQRLGRNIGSLADNYANIYRKKALKPKRWSKGKELHVIEITFKIIKKYWEELGKK
ncbi:hypothetical protein A3K73_00310 [Candidatus Pacearchaeota archaeon RBG_13_36_9]|nr:MAG: hypothetical protein A3K73_00310 [Candidatus Pacearchaeota archaeon RBG_13_36_9]